MNAYNLSSTGAALADIMKDQNTEEKKRGERKEQISTSIFKDITRDPKFWERAVPS